MDPWGKGSSEGEDGSFLPGGRPAVLEGSPAEWECSGGRSGQQGRPVTARASAIGDSGKLWSSCSGGRHGQLQK